MKPLIVLFFTFAVAALASQGFNPPVDWILAGNVAMCVMLLFTSIGHFKYVEGMSMMLAKPIPYKKEIIYLTGVVELVAGIMLLFPKTRDWAAIFLIAFFIVILPANIYAAINRVDFEKKTFDGPGPNYLWFRVPLQLFFIFWVWFFAIYLPTPQPPVV